MPGCRGDTAAKGVSQKKCDPIARLTVSHHLDCAARQCDMRLTAERVLVETKTDRVAEPFSARTRDRATQREARDILSPVQRLASVENLAPFVARISSGRTHTIASAHLAQEALEARATFRTLREPLEALHRDARPGAGSLAERAPQAAATLTGHLADLRARARGQSTKLAIMTLHASIHAKSAADWRAVEKLAARQNASVRRSGADKRLLFAAFHDAADPIASLFLLTEVHSPTPVADARTAAVVAAGHKIPALLFAHQLGVSPERADSFAFALHDEGAVFFDTPVDRRFASWRAKHVGLSAGSLAVLERQILIGHETAHFFDPGTLPTHTSELFADLGAFVAVAHTSETPRSSAPACVATWQAFSTTCASGAPP